MTPWLQSTIKFKKNDQIDRNLGGKLFISADATVETIKNAPNLKALDSRIPKMFDFTRIAGFCPKL